MNLYQLFSYILLIWLHILQTKAQGPDPWNFESKLINTDGDDIPPDLRMPLKRKTQAESKLCIGEWFFKRTLAIVLKGGDTKKNEDGSVDISLQMNLNPQQWVTLEEAMKSTSPLTEDTFRRSVAYVEESIYKPSIVEKIVLTWSEYFQVYLAEYKIHITGVLAFLAFTSGSIWVWKHMSRKQVVVLMLVIFYTYEVVISYKEAEQKELEKFITAVNKCNWYFWNSYCEVPPPDPLVFLKHMNPLKIGIRMFTSAVTEPFIIISSTVETIFHGVTDGLWYPFNKMLYGILVVIINISLIFMLVMILFNWLLNIPFSLSLFGVGLSVNSRRSKETARHQNSPKKKPPRIQQADGINQATLDKILNVCSLALSSNTQTNKGLMVTSSDTQHKPTMRKSASTGRLSTLALEGKVLAVNNTTRRRNIGPCDGSGDAKRK